jgi:hypothetical protein
MTFHEALERTIRESRANDHKDNYDTYRFGPEGARESLLRMGLSGLRRLLAGGKEAKRTFAPSQLRPSHHTWSGWSGSPLTATPSIGLYLNAKGAYTEFVLHQYEYQTEGRTIGVAPGDVVMDAGACWGDTALLFAREAGPGGRVFSYEFLPSNLAILRRNLSINPDLSTRVTVVERPLWSESGKVSGTPTTARRVQSVSSGGQTPTGGRRRSPSTTWSGKRSSGGSTSSRWTLRARSPCPAGS